jgi:phage gp29-like protein
MATRYAQIQPEQLAQIQAELERGQLTNWADLVDRMIQRDPDILATYESRLSVISGAEVVVEPGVPTGDPARDALADECARWVDSWLRAMPVAQYAHESLDGIGRGLAVHEIIWSVTDAGLVPTALQWLHLRRFCYSADWRPRIMDMGGDLPVLSSGYELEPDRFVCHEPRALPGYPTGGVFRAVMWLFLIKSWAMQFWVAGAESFAWPLRVATVPRSSDATARATARQFLEDLSQDHAGVLDEGMQLQLLETTAKDGNVWSNLVNECNRGIAKALLGMTDLAEPTRVGAYAAVETRKGATVDARVLKDERALAMTWERDLIGPAVRLNADRWGGIIPPIPRLRWSIAARRQALDPVGVLSMTVDEVRSSMGREPVGGILGAQSWRDYVAGKSPVDPEAVGSEQPVADTALNGAQIASLIQIIGEVAAGRLPRETGVQIIAASFPTIASQADSIMGEVGKSFVQRAVEATP